MAVTAAPITGKEEIGSLSEPRQALAQFYRAFNNKDEALMAACWDQSSPVTNANQLGGIQGSRDEVLDRYQKIFQAPFHVYAEFVEFGLYDFDEFCVVLGHEQGTFEKDGEKFSFRTRDTRILRRVNGKWLQVHHHGSFEDPKLLKQFQDAAKG